MTEDEKLECKTETQEQTTTDKGESQMSKFTLGAARDKS